MATKTSKEVRRKQRAEKKKQRARNRRKQVAVPKWARQSLPFEHTQFHMTPRGQLKMSEVILGFAEPLLNYAKSDSEFNKAISIAALAWNLSLVSEKIGKNTIREQLSDSSSIDEISEIENVFAVLMERKKQLYPTINRFILDYEVTHSENSSHVNVLSTVLEPGAHAAQSTKIGKASRLSAANIY